MADTKLTALSELSVIALDDITYVVDDVAGTPTSVKSSWNRVGGLLAHGICQGRLTTESGVPISSADRTSQGTLYFTPYDGNKIAVYDGTRWKLYTFSQISLALNTAESGGAIDVDENHDVFVYDNAGTLTLELSAQWTNGTTRADALTTQDGVYVKSGATTRRWLGTIRASGSGVTEDSQANRFVSNAYNAVQRSLTKADTTETNYSGADRDWNGSSSSTLIQWVQAIAQEPIVSLVARVGHASSAPNSLARLRVDGANITTTFIQGYSSTTAVITAGTLAIPQRLSAGYHSAMARQQGAGTGDTFFEGLTHTVVMG